MSETPAQRMFRQIQEMKDAFPNGFGILDGVKAELAEKDATITALRAEVERLRRKHHPMCYQNRGIPDDLPADLCDCKILWILEGGQLVTQRAESAEAERDALREELVLAWESSKHLERPNLAP